MDPMREPSGYLIALLKRAVWCSRGRRLYSFFNSDAAALARWMPRLDNLTCNH